MTKDLLDQLPPPFGEQETTEDLVSMALNGLQVLSLVGSRFREVFAPTSNTTTTNPPNIQKSRPNSRQNSLGLINIPGAVGSIFEKKVKSDEDLPIYSLKEVSLHDSYLDCWTIVRDRVYDITEFLDQHPGGDEIMMEYAGRDSTLAFKSVGHGPVADKMLEDYLIGILPEEERIWLGSTSIFSWSN